MDGRWSVFSHVQEPLLFFLHAMPCHAMPRPVAGHHVDVIYGWPDAEMKTMSMDHCERSLLFRFSNHEQA
jgi:hypothetical protein